MVKIFGQRRKKSLFSNLSGIASICSTTIVCVRLAYFGILSLEWTAFIMVAVVILVAIGNVVTRLSICAVAIFLFAKYVSRGNEVQFQGVLGAIFALLIAFIGLYIIVRSVFN